jgi:hypothetical protein
MDWNWWVFLTAVVAWLLQNVVHEGSHALVARVKYDVRVARFFFLPAWFSSEGDEFWKPWSPTKPYPDARFVFAGVVWKGEIPHEKHSLVSFAPNLGALVVVAVAGVLMAFLPPSWRLLVLPFLIAPLIDVLVWWRGYFWGGENTDGYRWRYGRS